jgi:hypothetical protein
MYRMSSLSSKLSTRVFPSLNAASNKHRLLSDLDPGNVTVPSKLLIGFTVNVSGGAVADASRDVVVDAVKVVAVWELLLIVVTVVLPSVVNDGVKPDTFKTVVVEAMMDDDTRTKATAATTAPAGAILTLLLNGLKYFIILCMGVTQ